MELIQSMVMGMFPGAEPMEAPEGVAAMLRLGALSRLSAEGDAIPLDSRRRTSQKRE
jgi:hypothetical protein